MRNSNTIKTIIAIILALVPIIIIPGYHDFFYYPKILMVYVLILFVLGIHKFSWDLLGFNASITSNKTKGQEQPSMSFLTQI